MAKRTPRAARSKADRNYIPKKRSPLSTAKVITRERSRSPSVSPSPCVIRTRSALRGDSDASISTSTSSQGDGRKSLSPNTSLDEDAGAIEFSPPESSKSSDDGVVPLIESGAVPTAIVDEVNTQEPAIPIGISAPGKLIVHLALSQLPPQPQVQVQITTQPVTQAQITIIQRPPTTFHDFSKLPDSVRNRIWKYLLPGPRNIAVLLKILQQRRSQALSLTYEVSRDYYPIIALNLKALLQTCRESRAIALGSYKRLLGSTPQTLELPMNGKEKAEARERLKKLTSEKNLRNFYYAPTQDALLFSEDAFMTFCWTRGLISVSDHITMVPGSDVQIIMLKTTHIDYKEGIIRLLTRFAGLKYLGLSWDERKGGRDSEMPVLLQAEKERLTKWVEREWENVGALRSREEGLICQIEVMRRSDMECRAGWA